MKAPLLEINKPNLNGRLYTKECIENAMKKLPAVIPIARPDADDPTDLANSAGTATLALEGNLLMADCHLTVPEIEDQLKSGKLSVRTSGIGSIDEKGVVGPDYQIVSLILTDQPA